MKDVRTPSAVRGAVLGVLVAFVLVAGGCAGGDRGDEVTAVGAAPGGAAPVVDAAPAPAPERVEAAQPTGGPSLRVTYRVPITGETPDVPVAGEAYFKVVTGSGWPSGEVQVAACAAHVDMGDSFDERNCVLHETVMVGASGEFRVEPELPFLAVAAGAVTVAWNDQQRVHVFVASEPAPPRAAAGAAGENDGAPPWADEFEDTFTMPNVPRDVTPVGPVVHVAPANWEPVVQPEGRYLWGAFPSIYDPEQRSNPHVFGRIELRPGMKLIYPAYVPDFVALESLKLENLTPVTVLLVDRSFNPPRVFFCADDPLVPEAGRYINFTQVFPDRERGGDWFYVPLPYWNRIPEGVPSGGPEPGDLVNGGNRHGTPEDC